MSGEHDTGNAVTAPIPGVDHYLSKFGRVHSAAVFDHWAAPVIRAFELRPVTGAKSIERSDTTPITGKVAA